MPKHPSFRVGSESATRYFPTMNAAPTNRSLLDKLLDPVSACFTPETARALVALPPNEGVRTRVAELGLKAETGTLTPEEARDYDAFIEVGDRIAALQLKTRRQLSALG
jgi:hypothetical protein